MSIVIAMMKVSRTSWMLKWISHCGKSTTKDSLSQGILNRTVYVLMLTVLNSPQVQSLNGLLFWSYFRPPSKWRKIIHLVWNNLDKFKSASALRIMTQEKVWVLTCKRTLELFIPEPIHGDQDVHLNLSLGRPSWESNTGWNWNFESVPLQKQKPPQYILTKIFNDRTTSLTTTTDLSESHW